MILGGGGIKGGQVLGESDETASLPKHEGFSPDDVAASFYHALGIDHTYEYHTPTGSTCHDRSRWQADSSPFRLIWPA